MTRVFVYEYTCAAPPASLEASGAASLCAEGEAMRKALLADFAAVPGVEAFTLDSSVDEEAAFRAAARRADWSLVIAPEFDQILETRCRWVLEEGSKLLGPSPDAVRLCADKLALFQWWYENNVRTPDTRPWRGDAGRGDGATVALKPRFGAGGQNTFFLAATAAIPPVCRESPMVVQPFIKGQPASVAFLIGGSCRLPLRAASQYLRDGPECSYFGGTIPLSAPLEKRALRIATTALDGIPGLFGYIGVDLILGDDGRDWAIEINPRMTTSYVGLRQLAETNLAAAMLRVASGEIPRLSWRSGSVKFSSDGTATTHDV